MGRGSTVPPGASAPAFEFARSPNRATVLAQTAASTIQAGPPNGTGQWVRDRQPVGRQRIGRIDPNAAIPTAGAIAEFSVQVGSRCCRQPPPGHPGMCAAGPADVRSAQIWASLYALTAPGLVLQAVRPETIDFGDQ